MSDTMTAAQRAEQLRAELAAAEQAEAAEREEQRRQADIARREHEMTPEALEQAKQLEQTANEQLDREFPPAWTPHKQGSDHPKQLVGQITHINPRVGPSPTYGTYSAAVEIVTTNHDAWTVWAAEGGALYSQLTRLRIQPGELVAIRYRGKKQSTTSAYSYNDYRLVRLADDNEPEFVDYDQLARERDQPLLPPAPSEDNPDDDGIPF